MKKITLTPEEERLTDFQKLAAMTPQQRYEHRLRELRKSQETYRPKGRPKDEFPRHTLTIRVNNEEELIIRELIAEFRKIEYPK